MISKAFDDGYFVQPDEPYRSLVWIPKDRLFGVGSDLEDSVAVCYPILYVRPKDSASQVRGARSSPLAVPARVYWTLLNSLVPSILLDNVLDTP